MKQPQGKGARHRLVLLSSAPASRPAPLGCGPIEVASGPLPENLVVSPIPLPTPSPSFCHPRSARRLRLGGEASTAPAAARGQSRQDAQSALRLVRSVRILFVHRQAEAVARCLRALESLSWIVVADVAANPQELAARLGSPLRREGGTLATPPAYDLILAEFPNPHATTSLRRLHRAGSSVPIIFLAHPARRRAVAALAHERAADWIEMDCLVRLPGSVRRLVDHQQLRLQRDHAQHGLRRTQAQLQALVDNPAFGIARCDANGHLVEGNQALATMLGYLSSQELLAQTNAGGGLGPRLLPSRAPGPIAPVELDWRRKDGTTLVVRCSGHQVHDEPHAPGEYEIIAEDLTLQRALVAQLRRRAATDPLTGLANYGQLADVLELELQRSRRTGRELAVLLLDLDGLKRINDTCGHLAGNRALSRVARILLSTCRSMDTPARFGGDEFAVVAPETSAVAALQLAHRIRERCARDREQPKLSMSIGTATYPADGLGVAELLGAADRSLYRRKHQAHLLAVEAPHSPRPVAAARARPSKLVLAAFAPLLARATAAGEPSS